ncbi:MAG: hypothetical protein ACR2JB_05400 [Bryobacteraceae bacterium]
MECEQTPFGIGDRLDERLFGIARWFVLGEESLDVLSVGDGIVAGQQDGAVGEPGFHGVQRRFGFSFWCFRAG